MAKLPRPPLSLASIPADIHVLPAGQLLWRVYRASGAHPSSWNTMRAYGPVATARFDHQEQPPHVDPDRQILYAAQTPATAIVEACQDTRLIDRLDRDPWLAAFVTAVDLELLDLTGTWPTRAGASQAIASGRRDVARSWSRLVWSGYPSVEGLRYRSSMAGGGVNIVIYERGSAAMPTHPAINVPLTHPGLAPDLNRIAHEYGYGLR